MKKIIIVGDLFLDILPSALPIEKNFVLKDGETFVKSVTFQRGGCAGNFAAVLATLMPKDEIIFKSKVGIDKNGDFLIEQLQSYGIKTEISKSNAGTAITIAVAYSDGERHFITYNGAMDDFKINEIDLNIFNSADHLAWRGIWFIPELLHNAELFLKPAKEKELTISMDLGYDPAWNDSTVGNPEKRKSSALKALKYVDFLFGNSNEIRTITNTKSLKDAMVILFERGVKKVIVHMGKQGAIIYDKPDSFIEIPAFTVHVSLNPVGTGDTHDAAFIFRYLNGDSIQKSAEYAARAASYSLCNPAGTKITPIAVEDFVKSKI